MESFNIAMYYVSVELKGGSRDYICAPSGWKWTEVGPAKDGTDPRKSGPEMSKDSYKRHFFESLAGAKIQAGKVVGARILSANHAPVGAGD